MKRLAVLVLAMICVVCLIGCNYQNKKMQYFFTAKVVEVHDEYLVLEVIDRGNSEISEETKVEVSTDVVSADGCPEFETGEYAKVLTAKRTGQNPSGRLEALSIYKVTETGTHSD